MQIPTAEQLEKAAEIIAQRGAFAPETIELGVLVMKDPSLQRVVKNMAAGVLKARVVLDSGIEAAVLESVITGAIMAGLNFGLTVGEP